MKEFIISVSPQEMRIALLEDKRLVELTIERQENRSLVGNIYKGRVDSIVPGIQAAFIDIGQAKNGFLYVSDIAGARGTGEFEFEEGVVRPKTRRRRAKAQSIETILKKNQHIMVQVSKDRLGTKGVRLTNFITLPGRYIVLMPTVDQLGVSRKIENTKERERLKGLLQSVRPKGMGLVTRTAGEDRKKRDFSDDVAYLSKVWERTKAKMKRAKSAALLHEDLGSVLRIVRDSFTSEVSRLVIDGEEEHAGVLKFLDSFAPSLKKRCKLYNQKRPIFDKYGIEAEIEKALRRKVYLKSGGSICIDQTEALVAVDVNTGKFMGKSHLEETVTRTNFEAAEEIARQVRLRDLGGIIVIDFIDMERESNRRELLKRLREALKADRAKTSLSEVSELGMIEMTRKRVKHNLVKALSQPCPYCEGSGMVRSVTTMTFDTLRQLQSLFWRSKEESVVLQVHPDVARRLRTENKDILDEITTRFNRDVAIESVSDFHIHDIKALSSRTRKEIKI